ncbi:MAG: TCP-1/cpn60 chaperonin family protein [Nitrososphaerota archaeon]|nr:TCP-1/cpn60 chaperonin family protein [Nitrososphaerota archaeon]MDG6939410.1 TCP-1/cpn60 chaperonin family protein [Nitrososphaerota archaeon]
MSTTAVPAVTSTGQPVLILKEGSSQSKGREAQRNNITAASLVAEIVKSSLGPRGMDKMLVDTLGDVTITNDGATILKEIDVQHPAAKMMVEISKATDSEVGDGTTSTVVLAGSLLEKAGTLIDKEVHPTIIVDGYRKAAAKAIEELDSFAIRVEAGDRSWLSKIAKTSLSTKVVSRDAEHLSGLVVDSLLQVADKQADGSYKVDIDNVKVEKKPGSSVQDTQLIKGIVVDKEVVHAGMPKRVEKAKIALVNTALEIEKTEFDAKINISDPSQMKAFLDEEARMLKAMVDKVTSVGANVVVCQKGIDDIAQHYLAKAGVLAVRRVKMSDMEKLAKATGGRVVTTLEEMAASDLGQAALVEERKIEEDKWVFVEGCKNPKAVTILIRGGGQRIVDEAERSVHDAVMTVKDTLEKPAVVAGAGAPEAELAQRLRKYADSLPGREQLAVQKFADSLEVIPLTIAENAGMSPLDVQVELSSAHGQGKLWHGVDTRAGKVADMESKGVFEPLVVKEQVIKSATEAVSMILRIDDVIAAGKSKAPPMPRGGGGGDMGGDY